MSFAIVMEGMTLIAFLVMIVGGKQKREQGWKVLSGIIAFVGVILATGMSLIVSFSIFVCLGGESRVMYLKGGNELETAGAGDLLG